MNTVINGEKIRLTNGSLDIPNNPIIPFIEGDGIGPDIWKASQMVFDVNRIIEYVSKFMTLKKGDLIFTGTPSGVGKMEVNDVFEAYLDGKKTIDLRVK